MQRFIVSLPRLAIAATALLITQNDAWASCTPTGANRPVCPAAAAKEDATFIDPTAAIPNPAHVSFGAQSYVGPFAGLHANSGNKIEIGEKTNAQDQVILQAAGKGPINVGDEFILAHGARVNGPAILGTSAALAHKPGFVGFNSLIDGGNVANDAMVLHLARIGAGVTVPSGCVVLSGKNVTANAQLAGCAAAPTEKSIPISAALRAFMDGVLHVNEAFAREYTVLFRDNPSNVRGINYDPGHSDFNSERNLPRLGGLATRVPGYRNRIIGDVVMADSYKKLRDDDVMGERVSLRADEGEPFHVGRIDKMGDRTTFHALEHTGIDAHDHIRYGRRSLVHGGASLATANNPHSATIVGDGTKIGELAVVFRSVVGHDSRIGCGSLVDGSTLAANTRIPSRRIVINRGHAGNSEYAVEWNPGCSDDD